MTAISALTDIFSSGFRVIEIWTLYFKSTKQLDQNVPGFEVVLFQSWVIFSKNTTFA